MSSSGLTPPRRRAASLRRQSSEPRHLATHDRHPVIAPAAESSPVERQVTRRVTIAGRDRPCRRRPAGAPPTAAARRRAHHPLLVGEARRPSACRARPTIAPPRRAATPETATTGRSAGRRQAPSLTRCTVARVSRCPSASASRTARMPGKPGAAGRRAQRQVGEVQVEDAIAETPRASARQQIADSRRGSQIRRERVSIAAVSRS